jgi:hypothetical protein
MPSKVTMPWFFLQLALKILVFSLIIRITKTTCNLNIGLEDKKIRLGMLELVAFGDARSVLPIWLASTSWRRGSMHECMV